MADEKLTDSDRRVDSDRLDSDDGTGSLFREMVNGLPLIVWAHDEAGEQSMVNDTFCEFFGVTREQMKGGTWQALMHPDDGDDYLNAFLACVRERVPFHHEVRVQRADGAWRWIESWARPRYSADHQFRGFVGTSADITERKAAEAALREANEELRKERELVETRLAVERALRASEERYRTLFESIDQGFCIMEMIFSGDGAPVDYRFLETNPPFDRHTGLKDAVGRTARELVPDLEAAWVEVYGRVAVTRESERFELGSEAMGKFFAVECFPIGEPHLFRVALLFSDITERRQAEIDLRDADRRKDDYLAMLGHELRNPLAAVRSATELVKLSARNDEQIRRASEVLERQTSHMAHLINGLLEVSRLARGKIHLTKTVVDLVAILNGVLVDRRAEFVERGVTLEETIAPESLWTEGDPVRLAQIFDNLVGNALKFTSTGGTVRLRAETTDGFSVVTVSDTGIGIDPENLECIFEPFHQEEDDVARASGGLGLGLALARELAALHDGSIEARSDGLGRGAWFEVRLPLAQEAPVAAPPPVSSHVIHGKRILIVEDNEDAAEMLHSLLSLQGHEPVIAASGAEALDLLKGEPPEVILCDIGLPHMSGHELARSIRANERLRHIKLIALTGYGQAEDRRESERSGFDDHLVKPVDLSKLNDALRDDAGPKR